MTKIIDKRKKKEIQVKKTLLLQNKAYISMSSFQNI